MAKTSRTSRPLKRKTSHSVIERRRREKINEGLIHLQDTVPACRLELRELLECKAKSNKVNARRSEEEVQEHVEKLMKDKSNSEMVLEKLCIISHTVDYVQELQDKVDAYRRWCRCSPPLPDGPSGQSHDQVHNDITPPSVSMSPPTSLNSHSMSCQDCASFSTAKRHWGSNRPLRLSRADTSKSQEVKSVVDAQSQVSSASTGLTQPAEDQSISELVPCANSNDPSSDLELDVWHDDSRRLTAAHLYTNPALPHNCNRHTSGSTRKRRAATLESLGHCVSHPSSHDRSSARLGLLAQVSAEVERVDESVSPISQI